MSDFNFEVFLSTDGKHTVQVSGINGVSKKALKWAKETYDGILSAYGTKQAQAKKEYAQENGFPNDSGNIAHAERVGVPVCPQHSKIMREGKFGYYCPTPVGTDENGKTLFCKYKPPKTV